MRIWVTGIGVVSPLAMGAGPTMDALLAGRRAFRPLTLFDAHGSRSQIAAEIPALAVEAVAPEGQAEAWSRTDAMAVLAAREALGDLDPERPVDLVLGGTTAGMFETEALLAEMYRDSGARRPLDCMFSHPLSATVDRMQDVVAKFRRARTVCSACSSGANALMIAASWLASGQSERVLAGGADGLCRLTYAGFSALAALSADPCRPFDEQRSGLSLGEGAAFLLLESDEAASRRGAEPIVELSGWAVGAEAHHITNPESSGETAATLMRAALRRAGVSATEVGYVNAHGTATRLNDSMETAALRLCFGEALDGVAVSSSKGQIGHTLGAAGAIEAAITVMALARGELPPTKGLETVDEQCRLNHVLQARRADVRAALSNSFGFGGSDAVLLFTVPRAFAASAAGPPQQVFVSASGSIGPLGAQGTGGARCYVEEGSAPPAGEIPFDAGDHLDLARARRIDRAGRMSASAMKLALDAAGVTAADLNGGQRAGAVLGAAFGAVDECSAFVHRIYEKGPRFASPAVFPNLLPSSPVAHASIYHRLRGPVFATADLDASCEGAIVTAAELIAAGEADLMLAGGVEQLSEIAKKVLGPLWARGDRAERSEGAAVLMLESAASLRARGGSAAAVLSWTGSWRGAAEPTLASLPAPEGRALVLLTRDDIHAEQILARSGWATVPRHAVAPRAGDHEGAGGFAAAAAVALLAAEQADQVLVVGLAPDRGYLLLLKVATAETMP